MHERSHFLCQRLLRLAPLGCLPRRFGELRDPFQGQKSEDLKETDHVRVGGV